MRRLLVCCFICCFGMPLPSTVRAQDSGLDLTLQVQRMQSWLGTSPNAEGWRRYLLLNQLESQAVKSWRGDSNVVNSILRQFESGQPGLEHPVFDGVRQALRNHAQQLPNINADVEAALANAPQSYVPNSPDRMRGEMARLQMEVELCKNRYLLTMPYNDAIQLIVDLQFDELQTTAAGIDLNPPQAPSGPTKKQSDDLRKLTSIYFSHNEKSILRRDRFFPLVRRQLERSLLQYTQLLNANPQAEFVKHLEKLKSNLASTTDPNQRAAQGEFALELGWLDATGNAPQLVAAVRARHSQPNLRFLVTESLAQRLASRPVNNRQPVNEVILGRQIFGDATTNGQVQIDFVDDPDQAHFSIHMLGVSNGNSHTHQGPVTAYAGSYADVEARRSILANIGGLIEYAPYGAANLSSEFRGVNCIRLVEKVALKQYERDKNASEAIGARRMEQRVISEFGKESSTAIRNAKDRMAQARRDSQSQLGLVPPMYIRTTNDYLLGFGLKAETFQISAPTAPPSSITVPADILLQIHESMLDNYLEPVLARQTIKNVELADKLKKWFGEVPEGLAKQSTDEIWGITLAASRPVQFIFDNNRFGIAIAGSKFTRDEQYTDKDGVKKIRVKETIDEPMQIKVMFRMQRDQGQLSLVRDGRATVEFTEKGVQTVPKNAFRSFLEDILNKSLSEQENAKSNPADAGAASQAAGPAPMKFPANLIPAERLQDPTVAQNLELAVLRSEAGWITAAWRYSPTSQSFSSRMLGPVDLPAIQDFTPPPAPVQ